MPIDFRKNSILAEDWGPAESVLINGFVFKKKWVRFFLSTIRYLTRFNRKEKKLKTPQKILVSNIGNLGDVLISTSVLTHLRRLYPEAQFGLLIASHCKVVTEILADDLKVHTFDHFRIKREKLGWCKAALQHFVNRKKTIQELRKEGYDWAIDLHPFYPNSVSLIYRAQIPCRFGYPTAGFGHRLTHPFEWCQFDQYLSRLHLKHLRKCGVPLLSTTPDSSFFSTYFPHPEEYIVAHICSSRKEKDLDREYWIQLIQRLQKKGHRVVLTGNGQRDKVECDYIEKKTGCINYCNKLTFSDLFSVIKNSKLLITVDSVSVHLAANQVPIIVLFSDLNSPYLWVPETEKEIALFKLSQFYQNNKDSKENLIEKILQSATDLLQESEESALSSSKF